MPYLSKPVVMHNGGSGLRVRSRRLGRVLRGVPMRPTDLPRNFARASAIGADLPPPPPGPAFPRRVECGWNDASCLHRRVESRLCPTTATTPRHPHGLARRRAPAAPSHCTAESSKMLHHADCLCRATTSFLARRRRARIRSGDAAGGPAANPPLTRQRHVLRT